MPNKRSTDMTSIFKPEAIQRLKQGQVLTFLGDDEMHHHYKIKITKDNRVLGKEIIMGKPEGLMIVEDEK